MFNCQMLTESPKIRRSLWHSALADGELNRQSDQNDVGNAHKLSLSAATIKLARDSTLRIKKGHSLYASLQKIGLRLQSGKALPTFSSSTASKRSQRTTNAPRSNCAGVLVRLVHKKNTKRNRLTLYFLAT